MSTVDQTPERTLRTGSDGTLARVKSTLITAMVFDILAIVVNVVGAFNLVGATYGMATEDHFTGVNLYFGYLADGGLVVFFIAAAVLSIAIAIRIWRMLDAANGDDLEALKRQSSLGWAVIAIFSGYVVTGAWLLRVNRALEA